ncbi:MAG: hypothetical protein PHI12_11125 [Dehalococcoidales bacterium]|nr:hypothetical protein [Dehalococcoidales bacterium]
MKSKKVPKKCWPSEGEDKAGCGAPLVYEESVNALVCKNPKCIFRWCGWGSPVAYCYSTHGIDRRPKNQRRPKRRLLRVCRREKAYEDCIETGDLCFDCPYKAVGGRRRRRKARTSVGDPSPVRTGERPKSPPKRGGEKLFLKDFM